MAKYSASKDVNKGGYTLIPEGEYIFKIADASYNDIKETVSFTLVLQNGRKHFETLYLLKKDGDVNQTKVDTATRIIAKAMQDDSIEELDTDMLPNVIDKYIKAEIQHQEYNGNTYAHVNPWNFDTADGFDEELADIDF